MVTKKNCLRTFENDFCHHRKSAFRSGISRSKGFGGLKFSGIICSFGECRVQVSIECLNNTIALSARVLLEAIGGVLIKIVLLVAQSNKLGISIHFFRTSCTDEC